MDEMTGSATGMDIPINGYKALAEHFRSGAMEVSSDEIATLHKQNVTNRYLFFHEKEGKSGFHFVIEASSYRDAFEKAYDQYGPQTDDMMCQLFNGW